MNLGNLIVGGGAVARGYREQEAVIRKAREDELKLQALNRANTQYKRARDEEQMANTGAAVAETAQNKFNVGVRPMAAPPVREKVVQPGVPLAKNVTTTLSRPAVGTPPAEPEKPQMTQQDFLALPKAEQDRLLQIANDRNKLAQVGHGAAYLGSGAFDAVNGTWNQIATGVEAGANAIGVPRLGRALGLYGPEVNAVEVPKFGDGSWAPMANQQLRGIAANKPMTVEDYVNTLPTRQGGKRRGGSAVARRKNAQAGLEIPGGEMMPAEGFASDAAVQRYNDLTQALPEAVQSAEGQQVISRAQELGVDPVAALTIFGIETSFGKVANESGKGAKGGMQVTDETFQGMKDWYTDGRGAEAGATPQQVAAAESMQRGDPQSEIDAGLLRIKYNEYVGVPKAHWGAAYQAPAEAVRDNGGPINADDGHFTNGEYNSVYSNLYNQTLSVLGGTAQGPLPGAVATFASTGRPEAVSGPTAAPARGGTGPAVAGPAGTAVAPTAQPAGVAVRPAVAAAAPKSKAQFYLANPQAITSDMAAAQDARAQLVRMGNLQLNLRTAEGYAAAQDIKAKIRALDAGMVDLQGIQGVQDWEMANDPGRLERALSIKTGQDVGVKMFTDGSVDLYINGKLAHENVDPGQLKDQALSLFDEGYRAQKAERATESHKQALEAQIEELKGGMETFRALAKAQIEGQSQLWVEKFKAENRGWDVKFSPNTDDIYLIPPGNRNPLIFNPLGGTVEMNGVTVPLTGAREIAGLNTTYFGGSKKAGEK